jgi:hypothetical protein
VSGEPVRPGKRRENEEKEGDAVAAATVLNWRAEVGDGRWGGAIGWVRAKRGGERGEGVPPTSGWCLGGSGPRPVGASGSARPWPQCLAVWIQTGFKNISNGFKILQTLTDLEVVSPCSKNWK